VGAIVAMGLGVTFVFRDARGRATPE
jgi:hypothetical protein